MPTVDREVLADGSVAKALRLVLGPPTRRQRGSLARAHRRTRRRQAMRALAVVLLISAALLPAMLAYGSQPSSVREPQTTASMLRSTTDHDRR